MTTIRLGLSELRRLAAGRLPRLAILAMALIPTLYAGLYLFANHDPYGNLDEVPAAVVVQDEGTTTTDPETGETLARHLGRDVADQLEDDGGFGWVETSQADAEAGVRSGRYDAALVIGPTFSADLASAGDLEPRQASLTLITNDANNYLARTIADQIVGQVRDSIAEQVGTEAADTFLRGFASIRTNLADAVDGADRLRDGATTLQDGIGTADDGAHDLADGAARAADGAATLQEKAGSLSDAAGSLDDGATRLAGGLGALRGSTADLPAQTRDLADGAAQVADGDAQVAAAGDQAAEAAQQVLPALDDARTDVGDALDEQLADLVAQGALTQEQADAVSAGVQDQVGAALDARRGDVQDAVDQVTAASAQLDELATGARQVADGADALADATPRLADGISSAADGADRLADGTGQLVDATPALVDGVGRLADGTSQVSDGATDLADGTSRLAGGAGDLVDGATDLDHGLADGLGQVPDVDDRTREDTAATIGNPVSVHDQALASAGTYGGGLAPFFLSLATWIGAYVLFLLVKPLSTRALAAGRSGLATALGGWLTPAAIGVVQVAAMFGVTTLALDIQPAHGVGTVLFLVLVSATFVAVLQALNVWLGAAGQFLGLVLMLVQLVTAGGTFPWQTIPQPLQSLHRFLPMSYAVEGLRQLLYGGSTSTVARDVAVLGVVLAVALGLTALAARRQRVWSVTRLQPELVL
ncbi:YhgE/Pip domain-containing protein [Cellulosimicrobium arenosum]|uniref:YhgE/Pip domain-containing protein n=1 Tax=Cellulosimicrobium arenosum TaxID=2708133 RepID=A0A927J0W7_9MICO|nr:YhgE/Pip domain-containing protein [Cellulosimicrobium arenosum]MBD8079810.1 YhgE/Pip domain-containing protein [Cellulosimicrobium arenosum]